MTFRLWRCFKAARCFVHQVVYAYNDILSVFAEIAFRLLLPLFLTLFMCLFIFLSLFYPPRVMNEELTSYE